MTNKGPDGFVKTKDYYLDREYTGHHLPRITTLDTPLIIEVAPTGSFIRRDVNPNQPYTPDEVAADVIKARDAGASMCHLHVRDTDGFPDQRPDTLNETVGMIRADADMVTSMNVRGNRGGATFGQPLLEQTIGEIVDDYGTDVIDMVTFAPLSRASDERAPFVMNKDIFADFVTYLRERDVKPELQAYQYKAFNHVKEWGVDTGLLDPPIFMNAVTGHHGSYVAGPSHPFKPAADYLSTLKETHGLPDDDLVLGANAGGPNWLPLAAQAILLGYDSIRIGMEDAITLYPHTDDRVESSAQMVDKIATIARTLGRDVATPDQARSILGV